MENKVRKILIGSPIHQTPEILTEFLLSLSEIDKENLDVHYYFVDDNANTNSSRLLEDFKNVNENVYIYNASNEVEYIKDEITHRWNESLIEKVTYFKNTIIKYAIDNNFDNLFFIDSDILVDQNTLHQLVSSNKDIISNVFWTQWSPNTIPMPQVWVQDFYSFHDGKSNENLSDEEVNKRTHEFLLKLKKPGVYKVGGLGACTLISRNALLKGVNFDPMYNISFWGEDRAFCLRAVALGFELFVDTNYPAYHIYRDSDLLNVSKYKSDHIRREMDIITAISSENIKDAILSLETYSYKENISYDFRKYFTTTEGYRLSEILKNERETIRENKIIQNVEVESYNIDYIDNYSKVVYNVNLIKKGYKNFYSFYEKSNVTCIFEKDKNRNILIGKYEVGESTSLETEPLVRRIAEIPKITLSMIVKNEEGRYLSRVLKSAREYIDEAVIIDDGSTDNTVNICREILEGIPIKIVQNKESMFSNEAYLRNQQWIETISTNPDWILFLDADEIFEDKFKDDVKDLIMDTESDGFAFRLYDFWDDDHYREDDLWYAHKFYRLFLIRYQPNFNYEFLNTAQHCGRMPSNVMSLHHKLSPLRLKHYGWSREADRLSKYNRYMKLDPMGVYGSLAQYISILDKDVNLIKWD